MARLQAARRLKPLVDGRAFIANALKDIEARAKRGEKVRVVFDIDDTLSESRARTLAVAKDWDRKHGTNFFSKLTLEQVKSSGYDTARAIGIPPAVARVFGRHWDTEFWKGERFVHDTPIREMVELAKRARKLGAEVVFLTGRVDALEGATIRQLKRFGLEGVDANSVVSKPDLTVRTAPFKTSWLDASAKAGYHLGFFVTESRRDIAAVQQWTKGAPAVLLESHFSGPHAVDEKTPTLELR